MNLPLTRTVLNRVLMALGGILFSTMIVLTCANILSRQVLVPIPGTFELMGYFGAVVTAFALGHTQGTRGHIAVDVLVNMFPKKLRTWMNAFNVTICMAFFALASWQVAKKALVLKNAGEVSETLRIIYYPFTAAVAAGCAVMAMILLTELLEPFFPGKDTRS